MPTAQPRPTSVGDTIIAFLHRLDRAPGKVTVALFTASVAGSVLVGLLAGIPVPGNQDQFSYLLAGETFASGRLANATHPLWHHFESFHIIHEPSYVSKYPPGQGLTLAFGYWLLGMPIVGVWLTTGVLTVAVYWLARGWIPRGWGVVAAVTACIQLGWISYWAQSYWGGSLAATGGALLWGAVPRAIEAPERRLGLVAGVGLLILANTRPLEGLVTSALAGVYVLWRLTHQPRTLRRGFYSRPLLTATLVVSFGFGWMAYYNVRTTGEPLRMAYSVHEDTYAMASYLPWEDVGTPSYRHEPMERFHREYGRDRLRRSREPSTFVLQSIQKTGVLFLFFAGVFGIPALFGLVGAMRNDPGVAVLAFAVGVILVLSLRTSAFPHYLAPVAGLIYVVFGACLAELHRGSRTSSWHLQLLRTTSVLLVASGVARISMAFLPDEETTFGEQRSSLEGKLASTPEPDLVVVRYLEGHSLHNEWVYNAADIDRAPVVWARDMGEVKNRKLLRYFSGRKSWLLEVGDSTTAGSPGLEEPVRLMEYPIPSAPEPVVDSREEPPHQVGYDDSGPEALIGPRVGSGAGAG